ncbi:MAG: hypothetical protein ACOC1P_03550 [Minisyncoccales bacterium]
MKKEVPVFLVLLLSASTAILFMGINIIDSIISSISTLHPEIIIEIEGSSLFLQRISFNTLYHLGLFLIVLGYFIGIGFLCLYISNQKN